MRPFILSSIPAPLLQLPECPEAATVAAIVPFRSQVPRAGTAAAGVHSEHGSRLFWIRAPLSLGKKCLFIIISIKHYLKFWGGRVTFFVGVAWWLRARALDLETRPDSPGEPGMQPRVQLAPAPAGRALGSAGGPDTASSLE